MSTKMTAAEALEALDVHRQHCPRGYHCSEPCECPVGAAVATLRAALARGEALMTPEQLAHEAQKWGEAAHRSKEVVAALRSELASAEARAEAAELEAGTPTWVCADCGNSNSKKFREKITDNPISGRDIDVACAMCGSTNTGDIDDILHEIISDRDQANDEVAALRSDLARVCEALEAIRQALAIHDPKPRGPMYPTQERLAALVAAVRAALPALSPAAPQEETT